jgi:hypothetical protein
VAVILRIVGPLGDRVDDNVLGEVSDHAFDSLFAKAANPRRTISTFVCDTGPRSITARRPNPPAPCRALRE